MLLTVVSFLLVLSLLVFVHELGHYLAARHVGVRVQQFSIGFPPRLVGRKVGDTEYLLSWIPLGGYVRLEGQNIDDENPADPRNYAAKTKLQRLYILVAGPAMNLLLALLLMPVVYMLGVEAPAYRQSVPVLAEVEAEGPAGLAGFRGGDRIAAVDSAPTASWDAVYEALAEASLETGTVPVTVARGTERVTLELPRNLIARGQGLGWRPLIPPVVGEVAPGSAAADAGLRPGDRIVAIAGTPIDRWDRISEVVQRGEGTPLALKLERAGQPFTLRLAPRLDEGSGRWLIGISPGTTLTRHGPWDALLLGTERLADITATTFVFLGRLVTGSGSLDALGGPVKIGAVVGQAARTGAVELIFLMAVISLQLGIFNLLPIPALDGGHIFLLGVERLNGGPLSARFRERAQMIGFAVILTLILFVTYNDIVGLMT